MKAYWIAHVNVTDPEQYQHYTQRAPRPSPRSVGACWPVAGAARRWKDGPRHSVAW